MNHAPSAGTWAASSTIGGSAGPACTPDLARLAETQVLPAAAAAQPEEAAFADPELRFKAASWQRRQQEVAAALRAAAQQQPLPCAPGAAERLAQLQQQNLRCLQVLHALHIQQMQQHLSAAAALEGGQGGPAGGGPYRQQTKTLGP